MAALERRLELLEKTTAGVRHNKELMFAHGEATAEQEASIEQKRSQGIEVILVQFVSARPRSTTEAAPL